MVIAFRVPGVPAPQGSKTPWGSEANPRTGPWRAAIAAHAEDAMEGAELLLGPVSVFAEFWFPRPKAHYRTGKHAHLLRNDAPLYKSGKPDLDKLLRAIGDALTGVVLRDDSQIICWTAVKRYSDTQARVELQVVPVPSPREEQHGLPYTDEVHQPDPA